MKKKYFLPLALFLMACLGFSFGPAAAPAVADSRDSVHLPILMYHGITSSKAEVNEYNILDATFEADLKWLGDNGFTSISAAQLAAYGESGEALPPKPVLITFDDGYSNNYSLAFPLLQKYHMKAVMSVIGLQTDESSDDIYRDPFNCGLNWGEISIMAHSGNVEIGNHTYALHKVGAGRKGADKKKGESQEAYAGVLSADLIKIQQRISAATGAPAIIFAWPYGAYPKDGSANSILKEAGIKISLTSYQKMNLLEAGEPDALFGLKRFLRTPDFDMNKIIW